MEQIILKGAEQDIEAAIKSLKINRDNAIRLIALDRMISSKIDEAKDYLIKRCTPTEIDGKELYISGGFRLQCIRGERKTYLNERIKILKTLISAEEKLIASGEQIGDIKSTKFITLKLN